jgi:OOP family OmpA-OmpF porin
MKNVISIKLVVVLGVLLNASAIVFAEDNDGYSSGYLGVRAGYSYNSRSCEKSAVSCDKNDAAYGIFTGYEFNRSWALELSYNDIGDSVAKYPGVKLDGRLRQADLSLKASYPITDNPNGSRIYGKLGAAYWDAKVRGGNLDIKDDGVRPLAGIGVEFPMNDHWTTRLEYQYIDQIGSREIGRTDAHFLGLALVWNFTSRAYKPIVINNPQPITPAPIVPVAITPDPVTKKRVVVDEQISGPLFEFDKSTIRNTKSIDVIVEELLQQPSLMVSVTGHTDSRGAAEYNQRLSDERANAVAKYLQSKGVASNRITVQGEGEMQPVADNQTEEGRARNRRVEFVITGAKTL